MARRVRTALQLLAGVTLLTATVSATAIPGGSQEASPGLVVTHVSGGAFGAYVELLSQDSGSDDELNVGAIIAAIRADDTATLEQLLADAGIAVDRPEPAGATETVTAAAGPAPEVMLPPESGGPFTDSRAALDLVIDTPMGGQTIPISGGGLDVTTQGALGPGGYAASGARVLDLNPDQDESFLASADAVQVECTADVALGPRGSTTFIEGVYTDQIGDEIPLPDSPAPNTVLLDLVDEAPISGGGVFRVTALLIANEQLVGPSEITVHGLRGELLFELVPEGASDAEAFTDLDFTFAQARCGALLAPRVEPTFTG